MKWTLIQKTPNPTIEAYGYEDKRVKEFLRQEGGLRCVYCAVHENALGGVQGFHVEHYKPKRRFPVLINSLNNLFYSCPICNRFKSSDWPAEPNKKFGNSSYPNPSQVDYAILFEVDQKSGSVNGKFVASKYIVERLYFNRPQLILERRQYFLDEQLNSLNEKNKDLIKELKTRSDKRSLAYLAKLADFSIKLNELFLTLKKIPSYEISDVTKQRS
ncbi:MAG: hypothetical protein WC694_01190 [Candidatus Paceibacterota bacterium]|jgi:hypothetical protein